jgi:glycosyltransferase involved in cell wall biosynthesis
MSASAPQLVSVIVPARDAERTIGDCLASVFRMDFPHNRLEVLVVDNGSTDRTAEIAMHYPIRYLREDRRGRGYARNRGIVASSGELIAFTDADCLVSTNWLSELLAAFDGTRVSVAAGEVLAYPPATAPERYVAARRPRYSEWRDVRADQAGSVLARKLYSTHILASAVWRREVFDRIGLIDTRFRACEDADLCWRLVLSGLEVQFRPRAVVFHRHRGTVVELLGQHVGYGRGQAALANKYPEAFPWGWREELRAWTDLVSSAGRMLAPSVTDKGVGDTRSLYYPHLDFSRKLAQRLGFVAGALERQVRVLTTIRG